MVANPLDVSAIPYARKATERRFMRRQYGTCEDACEEAVEAQRAGLQEGGAGGGDAGIRQPRICAERATATATAIVMAMATGRYVVVQMMMRDVRILVVGWAGSRWRAELECSGGKEQVQVAGRRSRLRNAEGWMGPNHRSSSERGSLGA